MTSGTNWVIWIYADLIMIDQIIIFIPMDLDRFFYVLLFILLRLVALILLLSRCTIQLC